MSRGVSPITTVRSRGQSPARRAGDRRQLARGEGGRSRSRPGRPRSSRRCPARASLQPRDRLEVAGHQREPERVRPPGQRREQLGHAGRDAAPTGRPGTAPRRRADGRVASPRPARVAPRRRRRPPAPAGRARSRRRCGPRPRRASAVERRRRRAPAPPPRAAPARARPRPAAAACRRCRTAAGAAQRAQVQAGLEPPRERGDQPRGVLDVVELDHLDRRVHVAQRDRDDRRSGCRRARGGTRRRRCPCSAREAATVNGMPSASPAACSSSNTGRVERRAARGCTGPEPNWWLPSSFSSMPGASVANVTSTTIAMSGRSEYAVVRAPPKVISSCVDRARRRRRRGRRRPRPRAAPPRAPRSSRAGCPSSARRRGRWAARPARRRSPRRRRSRTSERASSPSLAPMSMCRLLSSGAFLRSSSLSRWIGFLPTTPGDRARRASRSRRAGRRGSPDPSRRRR